MALIRKNDVILFQGDSITDCGRNYSDASDLGRGYPFLIASALSAGLPEFGLRFINKGIGGNRCADLAARWQEDCLALEPRPTVVTIMIGVNDTWRRFDQNDPTSTEDYENNYMKIAGQVVNDLGARLVILEPFVLHVRGDMRHWRADLDPKIQAARNVAQTYKALYIPLDGMFAAAAVNQDPTYWAADGVHPTIAGHGLISQAFLNAVMG